MDIRVDAAFRAALLHKIEAREFKVRTGVHCSDLVYCLNKSALRRLYPRPAEDHELLLFSLGWSTQRWLTGQPTDEDEIEQDGIIVTQDAKWPEISGMGIDVPWECKATFQSSERPIIENTAWIHQIMAQCYVAGTTGAKLTRLEIMGDWKSVFGKKEEKSKPEHRKPTLTAYHLEFSPDELCRNWEWLLGRAEKFRGILATKTPISMVDAIPSGQDWECGYCSFKGAECQCN